MKATKILERTVESETYALTNLTNYVKNNEDDYENVINILLNAKGRVIFMGVGKSGHVGQKLAATFASTGTPSFFVHATEAMHGDLGMITKSDLVIDISNSGETKEALAPLEAIHKIGASVIALTGNKNSSLAKQSDYLLLVHIDKEADRFNLAPTTSSTAVLAFGDGLALAISELKGFTEDNFGLYHPGGALGARLFSKEEG
ncbi:KpsF/GutQ family sugar-phosphate isomerase [Ligilactobacillus acidipiscis]|uniref:KpsF/GutQ family sugar-phosphate isomerase n=1 Tax=Ligilactobacillus acidipiscis TaxID=89059 RepID=UPI0022E004FB|nr:SIS domain-containing protein [Ligilactobacillus acidipiscis]